MDGRFQSTPPHGGRHGGNNAIGKAFSFNPRPRMGGDRFAEEDRQLKFVSIHAPAWGATRVVDTKECKFKVSIHAPAWGATWEADM